MKLNRNFIYLNGGVESGSEMPESSEKVEETVSFKDYEKKYNETKRYLEGFATGVALQDTNEHKDIYQTEAQNALSKMQEMIDPAVFDALKDSEKKEQMNELNDIMVNFAKNARESVGIRIDTGGVPQWLSQTMEPEIQNERENLEIDSTNAVSAAVGRVIEKGLGQFTSSITSAQKTEVSDLPGNWSVDLSDPDDIEKNIKKELLNVSSVDLGKVENGYEWNIDEQGMKVKVVKEDIDNGGKPLFTVKLIEADASKYDALAKAIEDRGENNGNA